MNPQENENFRVRNVHIGTYKGKLVKFFDVEQSEKTSFGKVWSFYGLFTANKLIRNDELLDTVSDAL